MEALSREAISFYIKGDGFDKHIIYVDETLYVNDIGNLYIEYPFYANEVVSIDLEQPVEENNLAGNKKVYKLQSAAKNKYFLKAQLLGRETLNIQEINNDDLNTYLDTLSETLEEYADSDWLNDNFQEVLDKYWDGLTSPNKGCQIYNTEAVIIEYTLKAAN